jgi:hypothetical protein
MILFQWLQVTPSLVYHKTGYIEKFIPLTLHAYEERPN